MASFWTRRNKKIRSVRKRYELLPQKGWKYVNIYNAVTLRQFWLDFIGSPLSVLSLFPKNDISWTVEKTISHTHRCWTQFIQLILRLSYKQKQTDRRTREGHREKNKKKDRKKLQVLWNPFEGGKKMSNDAPTRSKASLWPLYLLFNVYNTDAIRCVKLFIPLIITVKSHMFVLVVRIEKTIKTWMFS